MTMGSSMRIVTILFYSLFLTFATFSNCFCNGNSDVLCIESEREALLQFKQHLIDPSNRLSSWAVGADDCCKWAGVVCDNFTGHVHEIHLRNPYNGHPYFESEVEFEAYQHHKLGGKISPSLLNLKHLNHLDLSYNDFEGIPIPSFIGSLESLRHLNLSWAGFGGMIPSQLGNLSMLHSLSLGAGPSVENLQWLSGLPLLQYLEMSWVNLSTANDWLQVTNRLPSLVELHLSGCELNHIPPLPNTINFTSLAILDLSYNGFDSSIPEWLFTLTSLVSLDIHYSYFHGPIPGGIQNMTSLKVLDVSDNQLNSSLPMGLFCLNGLVSLHLGNNDFHGPIPSGIQNMTSLKVLDVSDNQLNSSLPMGLFCLNGLVSLHLGSNDFHGPITGGIQNMTSLKVLDVSYNYGVNSSLPMGLFCLNGLVSLHLGGNDFHGPIPGGLQNMTSLKVLDMSSNSFNSTIPNSWLSSLSRLENLNLGYNNLEGAIPTAIGNLTSLARLDLSSNQLKGRIPRSLGNLCNLREIDLSFNSFVIDVSDVLESFSGCVLNGLESLRFASSQLLGHLSDQLAEFQNLNSLSLSGNSLSGSIPESIGRLSSLKILYFSDNKFNGTLPKSFGQLVKLEDLDISNNLLEGVVSEVHFPNLTRLRYLRAGGNMLTFKPSGNWVPPFQLELVDLSSWQLGPQFPMWLQSQRNLGYLYMANTGILDTIPTWFWSISSQLYYLDLSQNQIHGEIPNLLQFAAPFPMINLGSNHFEGPLPLISSNISFLNLSNNHFSGSIYHFLCKRTEKSNSLEGLHLENNSLSRGIPDCWKNWPSLKVINLENNNLMGNIPDSMGYLRLLRSLHFRNNNLSGNLPMSLQNCTELVMVDLAENEIIGNIPTWIGKRLSQLKLLNLRSNKFQGNIPYELCYLTSLQILDLAHNNLWGTIPRCFKNFSAMAVKSDSFGGFFYSTNHTSLQENALLVTKGKEYEYSTILDLVTNMDLSKNNLSGKIPSELMSLLELQSLNLSENHLTGRIPQKIGDMRQLESLDFSMNQLFGEIPSSLSSLTFLSHLNLSYNNLTGKIPSSTQLQGFSESSFVGNSLCGPPLTKNCNENVITPNAGNEGEKGDGFKVDWFFVSMALGFIVGFWAVLGPLLFNMAWRIAYFQFLDSIGYKLYDIICKYCYIFRN